MNVYHLVNYLVLIKSKLESDGFLNYNPNYKNLLIGFSVGNIEIRIINKDKNSTDSKELVFSDGVKAQKKILFEIFLRIDQVFKIYILEDRIVRFEFLGYVFNKDDNGELYSDDDIMKRILEYGRKEVSLSCNDEEQFKSYLNE